MPCRRTLCCGVIVRIWRVQFTYTTRGYRSVVVSSYVMHDLPQNIIHMQNSRGQIRLILSRPVTSRDSCLLICVKCPTMQSHMLDLLVMDGKLKHIS